MIVEYEGKRYALKIVEIENPSESAVDDFDRLEYLVWRGLNNEEVYDWSRTQVW